MTGGLSLWRVWAREERQGPSGGRRGHLDACQQEAQEARRRRLGPDQVEGRSHSCVVESGGRHWSERSDGVPLPCAGCGHCQPHCGHLGEWSCWLDLASSCHLLSAVIAVQSSSPKSDSDLSWAQARPGSPVPGGGGAWGRSLSRRSGLGSNPTAHHGRGALVLCLQNGSGHPLLS